MAGGYRGKVGGGGGLAVVVVLPAAEARRRSRAGQGWIPGRWWPTAGQEEGWGEKAYRVSVGGDGGRRRRR
jgi:hypothetical protein